MKVKISILVDKKLDNNLRLHQADLIRKTKKSVSFSDTVNQIIIAGMNNINKNSNNVGKI